MAINSGSSAYSIPVGNDAKHESLSYAAVPFHTSAPIPSNDSGFEYKGENSDKRFPSAPKKLTEKPVPANLRSGSFNHVPGETPISKIGPTPHKYTAEDNGPTGKKFSESLHERKNDGKFVETTKRSKPHHERED